MHGIKLKSIIFQKDKNQYIFRIFISQKVLKSDTEKKGSFKHSSRLIQNNISKLRAIKVLCIYVANIFCADCSLEMLAVDHLTF